VQGLLLGGTAASQPGPFQAYLLAQTLSRGWRRTLLAALAPLISDGPILALVILILVQTPSWFLALLQIVGGFFLLYLARGSYRTFQVSQTDSVLPPIGLRQMSLFQAVLVNALSPGPYIFWATIGGPILIDGWRRSPVWGISFIGGFYGALIGGFAAFITLFAVAKRLDPRLNRSLSAISVLALLLFGLYQLWQGIQAVIGSPFVSMG
jgi:threonine/homoserine/homoserine lactone efflux protein